MTQTAEIANQLDLFSLFFQATWFVKFIMLILAGLSVLVWAIFFEKMRKYLLHFILVFFHEICNRRI